MSSLSIYTSKWANNYNLKVSKLPLFKENFGKELSIKEKQKLVLTLYHIRGNFYKFLWTLGSIATSYEYKKVVLENYAEEFGRKTSHEKLYNSFAEEFEVDINKEILEPKHNFQWVQDYNNQHIKLILTEKFEKAWALFGAYEKLDNIDYENLYHLAANLGSTKKGLVFFNVHRNAGHFDTVSPLLNQIWEEGQESVEECFKFIANHQLKMWQNLYEEIVK